MTKLEYIKQLEQALKGKMSDNEIYDIMRDYAEYFEEGKKQNKTEDEIAKGLGIPYAAAAQILGEEMPQTEDSAPRPKSYPFKNSTTPSEKPPKPPKQPMDTRWIWLVVGIILSPVIFGLLTGLLGLMVGAIGIIIGGIAILCTAGIMAVSLPISAVFFSIFSGIACMAAGLSFFCLLIMLLKWCIRKICDLFKKKEPPTYTQTPPVQPAPTPPAAAAVAPVVPTQTMSIEPTEPAMDISEQPSQEEEGSFHA